MRDLRLVLRDPSDVGQKRKLPTPAPDNLMDKFVTKWYTMEQWGQ